MSDRYLLKLADGGGYFEEVDKYTFDNSKSALAEDSDTPRYMDNACVVIKEDGTLSIQMVNVPVRDIAILQRALQAIAPERVQGGFIREPQTIKFRKGKTIVMREMKTGENWVKRGG